MEGRVTKLVRALEVVMSDAVRGTERMAGERTGSVDGEEMEGRE